MIEKVFLAVAFSAAVAALITMPIFEVPKDNLGVRGICWIEKGQSECRPWYQNWSKPFVQRGV